MEKSRLVEAMELVSVLSRCEVTLENFKDFVCNHKASNDDFNRVLALVPNVERSDFGKRITMWFYGDEEVKTGILLEEGNDEYCGYNVFCFENKNLQRVNNEQIISIGEYVS